MISFREYLNESYNLNESTFGKVDGKEIENSFYFKYLDSGTTVDGNVMIFDDKVLSEMPNNLTINGNLILDHCVNLKLLPVGLIVNGYFEMTNMPSCRLSRDLKVKKYFKTDSLKNDDVAFLPKCSIIIDGNLNLKNSKITKLPDNLKVTGDLSISDNVKSLPKQLVVDNDLYISYFTTTLPGDLVVNGDIHIDAGDSRKAPKIPASIKLKGYLFLYPEASYIANYIPQSASWKNRVVSDSYNTNELRRKLGKDRDINIRYTGDNGSPDDVRIMKRF